MEILHFNTQKERLAFLKGDFEEIIPDKVIIPEGEENAQKTATEPQKATSAKKSRKGKTKDGEVQAE